MALFRNEALENFQAVRYGGPRFGGGRWLVLVSVAIFVLAGLLLTWLWIGKISRKETIQGELLPSKGWVKVKAPFGGYLVEKRVEEGSSVQAGDILFVLSNSRSVISSNSLEDNAKEQLLLQQGVLEGQLLKEGQAAQADAARLRLREGSLRNELGKLDQEITSQDSRLALSQKNLEAQKRLVDQGAVAPLIYAQQEQTHLALSTEVAALKRSKLGLERAAVEAATEAQSAELRAKNRQGDYENQLSRVRQELSELRVKTSYTLRATAAGTISALNVELGQMIDPQLPLATILPQNQALKARFYAPTRAVGFIKSGQPVRLRYQAFPYERFGTYAGTVHSLSQSVLLPNELPSFSVNEAVYPVEVALSSQSVQAYGKSWLLRSGMRVEADIVFEKQRIAEWIIDPLLRVKGKL